MAEKKHKTTADMVKTMRQIRDEFNDEIKHMTFEEERAYLDQLLALKTGKQSQRPTSASKSID